MAYVEHVRNMFSPDVFTNKELLVPPLAKNHFLLVRRSILPDNQPVDYLVRYGHPIICGVVQLSSEEQSKVELARQKALEVVPQALGQPGVAMISTTQRLINHGLEPLFLKEDSTLSQGFSTVFMAINGANLSSMDAQQRHAIGNNAAHATSDFFSQDTLERFKVFPLFADHLFGYVLLQPRFAINNRISGNFYVTDESGDKTVMQVRRYEKGRTDIRKGSYRQDYTFPVTENVKVREVKMTFTKQ